MIESHPEHKLLLGCLWSSHDAKTTQLLKDLLATDINWDYLVATATKHRVMPLLYQSLCELYVETVPAAVMVKLQDRFCANIAYNLALTSELLVILKLLTAHKIPAIPFKGPVLAASVYGNISLRQSSDLDILVRSQDRVKVQELLLMQKYFLEADHGWQQNFVRSQKPNIELDLHWELTPLEFPFKHPDFEILWQRRRMLEINGEWIVEFSPDDMLMILTVQIVRGGHEGKESLAQICDLAQLISVQEGLDWERLLQQVKTLGLSRPFFISLHLVNHLLNASLPSQVKRAIQQEIQLDPVIPIYAARMQKRLFSETDNSYIIHHFFHYLMIRGTKSRFPPPIYLLWQFLMFAARAGIMETNQADREFLHLPNNISFLYYFIRPMRLIWALLKGE